MSRRASTGVVDPQGARGLGRFGAPLLAMLLALAAGPLRSEGISVVVDPSGESIVLLDLPPAEQGRLLANPGAVSLTVDGVEAAMPLHAEERSDGALVLVPRFRLLSGAAYGLTIEGAPGTGASDVRRLAFEAPSPAAPPPRVAAVHPAASVLPENALRLYLRFTAPMARGQAAERVRLVAEDGSEVENPFLNLGVELWNADQTRLTLLFDPGRIKQGVGPNVTAGPPLVEGRSYRLVVSGAIRDAAGQPIGADHEYTFQVGPPERRALSPDAWMISTPSVGTHEALTITFDRIMDDAVAARALSVLDGSGQTLRGRATSDAFRWTFEPDAPWSDEGASLRVAPYLEDIAANRLCSPFDAVAGSARPCDEAVELPILAR